MEDSKQIERPYDLDDRSQCGEREPIDHTSPARKRVDRRKRGRGRMGENGRLAVAAAAGAGAAANREGRGGAEPKPKPKAKARSWLLSASPRISRLSWFSSLFFFSFSFRGWPGGLYIQDRIGGHRKRKLTDHMQLWNSKSKHIIN